MIADFEPHSQAVFFKVLVKPLVNLIWLAGIVFVFGSLVALWPDAREQRRLVDAARARATREHARTRSGRRDRGRGGACSSRCRSCASRGPRTTGSTRRPRPEGRRLQLIEERDRALAALKELEFDHRTGQGSTTPTTGSSSARTARAAAVALRALERSEPGDLGEQEEVQADDRGGDD